MGHALVLLATLYCAPILLGSVAYADPMEPALVFEAKSGKVLYASAATHPWYPASLTKLMTLYLAFKALRSGQLKLTDHLTVSQHARGQSPVRLNLTVGEKITTDLAIRAIATASSNDVAVVMAEHLGGSETAFAIQMTREAKRLGMLATRFFNASGLPHKYQISTARDLGILTRAILTEFSQYYHYFSQPGVTHGGRRHPNVNGFLSRMHGADGVKTGFTCASGYNLIASVQRNGRRLVGIVLGSASRGARYTRMGKIISASFNKTVSTDAPRLADIKAISSAKKLQAPIILATGDCGKITGKSRLSGWSIHLGIYRNKTSARAATRLALRKLKGRVPSARPRILKRRQGRGTAFQAILTELGRGNAGRVCVLLRAQKLQCLAISPQASRNIRKSGWR